jgi:outer membrane lipoprotein-sorting protein
VIIKNIIKLLLTILIAFTFQFCSTPKPAVEERVIPAERLIKKIEGNRRKVKTFKGTGVIKIESKQFSGSANFEVQLKKPDSIKISIYGPFGIDLAHGLISGSDFQFYDVMRNKLYVGTNDKNVLKDLFKIDLSFNELMDAFSGSVNLTDKLLTTPDLFEQGGDEYILSYLDNENNQTSTYYINKSDLALTQFEVNSSTKKSIIKSVFNDTKLFDDVPIPYEVEVNYKSNEQKLSIEYRKIQVNIDIDKLVLKLPKDIEIIRL